MKVFLSLNWEFWNVRVMSSKKKKKKDSTVNCMTFSSQAGSDSVCTVMHILYGISQLQSLACLRLETKLMFVLKFNEMIEDVHWICLNRIMFSVWIWYVCFLQIM